MVYLTHYCKYPIYEAAEGGYYYEGREADTSYRFFTKWGAKRHLKKMQAELEAEGFVVCDDFAFLQGKYIGDGELWVIEKTYGSRNSGKQIYE